MKLRHLATEMGAPETPYYLAQLRSNVCHEETRAATGQGRNMFIWVLGDYEVWKGQYNGS